MSRSYAHWSVEQGRRGSSDWRQEGQGGCEDIIANSIHRTDLEGE